jgi:hypothetical protein
MPLSDLISVMRWSLDDNRNTVFTADITEAIEDRLGALDARNVGLHPAEDWVTLLEGAQAHGIQLPEDLLKALVNTHLNDIKAWDFQQQVSGADASIEGQVASDLTQVQPHVTLPARLLSPMVWHFNRAFGLKYPDSVWPMFIHDLLYDKGTRACATSSLCGLLRLQFHTRQWRSAANTAASIDALARILNDSDPYVKAAGPVITAGVRALCSTIIPTVRSDRMYSALTQGYKTDIDKTLEDAHEHNARALSHICALLLDAGVEVRSSDRGDQLSELRSYLAYLPARAVVPLLTEAPQNSVNMSDFQHLTHHLSHGLFTAPQLVQLAVTLQGITSGKEQEAGSDSDALPSEWWEAWSRQVCRQAASLSQDEATQLVQAVSTLAHRGCLPGNLLQLKESWPASKAGAPNSYSSLGAAVVGLVEKHQDPRGGSAAGLLGAASCLVLNQALDPAFRTALAAACGQQGKWHVHVPPQKAEPASSASAGQRAGKEQGRAPQAPSPAETQSPPPQQQQQQPVQPTTPATKDVPSVAPEPATPPSPVPDASLAPAVTGAANPTEPPGMLGQHGHGATGMD